MSAGNSFADSVVLTAVKDNTLIETDDGSSSNGAGPHFFAGRIARFDGERRRGLLAFDVAAGIPDGATVASAVLTLYMSKTIVGAQDVELYRIAADWGEGTSSFWGGSGAPSTSGDATWLHTFYDDRFWAVAGGDFALVASAVTVVDRVGSYSWGSTPEMVADVQAWLDRPAEDNGWILVADESSFPTVKRFDSRENDAPNNRPQLAIEYALEIPCDPQPVGQGYWHRQCLGVPAGEGGIDPGNSGNGPSRPTEPGFQTQLMPCADDWLLQLGFDSVTTCDGMDADPPNDRCERALKKLTSLVLNVCSGRLQTSCSIDARGCAATDVGELLVELAAETRDGNCRRADRCEIDSIERASRQEFGAAHRAPALRGGPRAPTPEDSTPGQFVESRKVLRED
jgi:hypothetical protein